LDNLGGIAAILTYPMPDLDEDEEEDLEEIRNREVEEGDGYWVGQPELQSGVAEL
jgi:hypothetical protein